MANVTWSANGTVQNETGYDFSDEFSEENSFIVTPKYIIIPLVLICLCTIAVLINVRILVATRWLRRPISPTLFISLSLALADSVNASLLGIGLLYNSLLPYGLGWPPLNPCILLTLEAARLSGILITMIHLLAQACNHYLGIMAPFKSLRWLTHNNVTVMVITIWVAPILFIFTYFSSFKGEGFQSSCEENSRNATIRFYVRQKFRGLYSTLIFIPLIVMFFIYCHISVIVRKHQAGRQRYTRQSRHGRDQESRNAQQLFDKNLKAIWTTLLILSSYMICLMPAVLTFSLLCEDCYLEFQETDRDIAFIVLSVTNCLLVIKPLLNPLIYASRMQEIRTATRRMNDSCRRVFYPSLSASEPEAMLARRSSFMSRTSTRRHDYSITSAHQIGNGYTRSLRRRNDEMTTDL